MKRLLTLRLAARFACLLLGACTVDSEGKVVYEPPPPGIAARPRWLTFSCVTPGCEQKLTAVIHVEGTRDIAIKRVVLSDHDRTDFTVEPSRKPPFILKALETFEVAAQYKPTGDPRLGDVDVLVTFTDASVSETDDRIPPGEITIPLVRRLVGEAALSVSAEELNFGPVFVTARKSLPLEIENKGFGNVGLVIESAVSDVPEMKVEALPPNALLPNEKFQLMVSYVPIDERFTEGELTIKSAEAAAPPAKVKLIGTSIGHADVAVVPEDGIDLGQVAVGMTTRAPVSITNRGAEALRIRRLEVTGAPAGATLNLVLPRGTPTSSITLMPLAKLEGQLELTGRMSGEVMARLRIDSSDPIDPVLNVPISGLITEPNISVAPGMIGFGNVPRGWSLVKPIEVTNTGYGDLVLSGVTMILGSSELFTLRTVPRLPATLRHGQRIGLEVEFRSEAEASFTGTLSIDTNDPDSPFVEVPLSAAGASCDRGCPIANGTPSCTMGVCAIASCDEGFHDSDGQASNGCECREVGRDAGAFCMDGIYAGSLSDEGNGRATYTGIIPTEDDVDMIRFHAKDEGFDVFDDAFDVRVRLESADPNITFCIYRHRTGDHDQACFLEDERCPGDRQYRRDGDPFTNDGADFIIKVTRRAGGTPSCTPYTLFMSND